MSSTTIILNGKKYDAVTGKLLGTANSNNTPKVTSTSLENHHPKALSQNTTPTSSEHHNNTKKTNHISSRAMKSATLMRHQLKKPTHKITDSTNIVNSSDRYKISMSGHKQAGHTRKVLLTRTASINKFNDFKPSAAKDKKVVTSNSKTIPLAPPPISQNSNHSSSTTNKQDIFLNAIKNANSHNQPKVNQKSHSPKFKKTSRNKKLVNITSFAVSLLILGGFFAYQNIPNMSLRLASKNSGIVAKAPGYIPSGFSMSRNVYYIPGQVTLTFKSNVDTRSFQLIQTASSWNSEDLKNNFLASNFENVQQIESNGKTIYLYDTDNATWVDGGVWYNLESNADLSSSQLLSFTKNI